MKREMLKGCKAYAKKDLCPLAWCLRNQHVKMCSKCAHFHGVDISEFQLEEKIKKNGE